MGEKLLSYYSEMEKIGGLLGKIKLSVLTKIASTQAESELDSIENIAKFEQSMAILQKEFGNKKNIINQKILDNNSIEETSKQVEDRLRKSIVSFMDLMGQRSLFIGNLEKTNKRITETIVDNLSVERASIWFYNDDRTQIECSNLFEKSNRKHSSGSILKSSDFPNYFKSIQSERTIAAHDANTDLRTSEFSEIYLKVLGITSMLDVPIWANGEMIGVICHEHVGKARTWLSDEENFAYIMANLVALAFENSKRS